MALESPAVFTCPHCWQPNEIVVDVSAGSRTLIQDCEVCCNPLELEVSVDDEGAVEVQAYQSQ